MEKGQKKGAVCSICGSLLSMEDNGIYICDRCEYGCIIHERRQAY